ncbi:MAG: hypothetical protein ACK4NC_01140 [Candidatus Gracilibacteria bacterium]
MSSNKIETKTVEAPVLPSSSERSFDTMKAIDISRFEALANNYTAAREYPDQVRHLENYIRELNRHNILIKRKFFGYEIATDSVPEKILPKALADRLQATLTKLYSNSYVVSKELQGIPVEKRRDISQETNLKKEHVSTQLEAAMLNNLLYSDGNHSTTVFSTVPSLDFKGVNSGAELKLNDVEIAIKRKPEPTIYEKQVLHAIEGIRSFGVQTQNNPNNSKERTDIINTKKYELDKILAQYKIAHDSKNVTLATSSELGTYSQKIVQNFKIDPASLNGKNALERTVAVAGTLGYRTVNNGLNHFSMLVQNPARMLAVIISLISLILPDSIKNSTLMKGLRQFTLWDSIALLTTNGEKGLVGLFKGTVNPMLEQMKGMADTSKNIDHDAVEQLENFNPVYHFEKVLNLNEAENKLTNIVYQQITVGKLMANTTLNEQTNDVDINANTLFTPEEKKTLAKWPKFQADKVYRKMLTAVYDANEDQIKNMTDKRQGKPPSRYSKEYLATLYLKEKYKYPLTGTKSEGNIHSNTTKFTTVFEYELIPTHTSADKQLMEKQYQTWLTNKKVEDLTVS